MSNLVVHTAGGALSRVSAAGGAAAPYVGAALRNIIKGGAQERAITRGVEAAAGAVANQVSADVVNKISEQIINNPSVLTELSKQLGPIVGKMAVNKALAFLHAQYKQHYYAIWTIISISALITIRVADLIFTRGVVTNTGARLTARGLSASGQHALKSARAVAKAIKEMGTPRSGRKKTAMLVLFIVLFSLITSISRPFTGLFLGITTPYLANRMGGGNNAGNVRRAVNNNLSPARQASPVRQSSPRRQSSPVRRMTVFRRSTANNNAVRMAARAARFASPNAGRMAARRARFGAAAYN